MSRMVEVRSSDVVRLKPFYGAKLQLSPANTVSSGHQLVKKDVEQSIQTHENRNQLARKFKADKYSRRSGEETTRSRYREYTGARPW